MKLFLPYFLLFFAVIPTYAAQELAGVKDELVQSKARISGLMADVARQRRLLVFEEQGLDQLEGLKIIIQSELNDVLRRRNGGRRRVVLGKLSQDNLAATAAEEREIREQVVECSSDITMRKANIQTLQETIGTLTADLTACLERRRALETRVVELS